jgi:hypothetical protein
MSAATSHDAVRSPEPTRVLLAVRGGEPDGWAREIPRVLAMWSRPSIRILAVLAAPAAAFTSLLPAAGRMYGCGVQDRAVRDVGCPLVLTPASAAAQEA